MAERLIFVQACRWQQHVNDGNDPYDGGRCAYCARPVTMPAALVRTARTNDGEWWLVADTVDLAADEWRDFQTQNDEPRKEVTMYPMPIVPPSLIREIPVHDRPRERVLREGGTALTDVELISVLLRTGVAGQSSLDIARELLVAAGGLAGMAGLDGNALQRRGLGSAKAATILAAMELARRVARAELPDRLPLGNPETVARYLLLRYAERDQEVMGALFLDLRNRLIGEAELYRGTLARTAVEPRAILKQALLRSAAGLLLFHTHPTGDPSPSAEDLAFTRRLADAGELLGVRLHDHLILGGGHRWVSLRRRGGW